MGMRRTILSAIIVVMAGPGFAQTSLLPEDLQKTLRETNAIWQTGNLLANVKKMEESFTPLLLAKPKGDVIVESDISYGSDPKQKLDIYRPKAVIKEAPVVIFVHGGAYVMGDRNVNQAIYGNIPTWFARQGVLALSMSYRLAPAATYPSGADDVSAVVAWAKKNAARYGADPDKIFLVGHSAGATHVATYAFNKKVQPASGPGIAGMVLMSGRYRLNFDPKDPSGKFMQAYFGTDPAEYPDRSVINHIAGSTVPTFVVIAEYDNPGLDVSGAEIYAALCIDGKKCPRFTRLKDHNHLSMVHSFDTADEALGREILEFVTTKK